MEIRIPSSRMGEPGHSKRVGHAADWVTGRFSGLQKDLVLEWQREGASLTVGLRGQYSNFLRPDLVLELTHSCLSRSYVDGIGDLVAHGSSCV